MDTSQQLPTANSSGTQNTTQNPQNSVQTGSLADQTGSVQTGGLNSLLESQNGIPLQNTYSSAINLSSPITQTSTQADQGAHHTPNYLLLGGSGLLFVVAIVLFWTSSRSAKNTTD